MAEFVHITTVRVARRVERSGVAARSHGRAGGRGVYCMPVLPSFTLTYQWMRELRRWHPGVLVAVHLRLPDDEPVTVGRYGGPPRAVTAAQAVAVVRGLDDPRGYEVFVPRAITCAEVRRIRDVPQGVVSVGGTCRVPTVGGPARARVAFLAAGTRWRGCAAGFRTTNRPGRRVS